jgi:NAD+ kinase
MSQPPRTIAIVAAGHRPDALRTACETVAWFEQHGVRVLCDGPTAAALERPVEVTSATMDADLVLVFGGDGTTISTLRRAAATGAAVIGVNFGTVGFLTEIPKSELDRTLPQLVAGEYEIETRLMLEAEVTHPHRAPEPEIAANDVVVKASDPAHVLSWRIAADGDLIAEFPADGLVISTPTGSTAYNLSAGGPVVVPDLQAMILTPICPHTLAARPLVLADDIELTITTEPFGGQERAILSIDGRIDRPLSPDDTLRVRKAPQVMHVARLSRTAFFDSLRGKLRWGTPK